MAPTKAELLAYLRQAQADFPQLTKEELAALALAHFAGDVSGAKQAPEKTPSKAELVSKTKIVSDQLIEEPVSTIAAASSPSNVIALTSELLQNDAEERPWPTLNRRVVFSTVFVATAFSMVIAGAYLYGLRTTPPQEKMFASVATLTTKVPDETGEIARFSKRFAGNATYYDDKYQGKVLELVGLVEVVERHKGYLEATLFVVDQKKNTVFRAKFRFLPEQEEAIALARGTLAVLKGNYTGYKDGIMRLFPAVVVYNSAQPEE